MSLFKSSALSGVGAYGQTKPRKSGKGYQGTGLSRSDKATLASSARQQAASRSFAARAKAAKAALR